MPHNQVNYDQLASTYNHRFKGESRSGTAEALYTLVQQLEAQRILEVGCGTGHWLSKLFPATKQVFGLDFSTGMLHQAQNRVEPFLLCQGRGGQLPFPNQSFDLVYCVNAIHHFTQQASFVSEAFRLLRPGGALAVIGFDPRQHRDKWYVYDFFPGTYQTDLNRFPSWGTVTDWMAAAGFIQIDWRLIEWIEDPKKGSAVLDDPYLQKHAVSQLALLTNAEYAAGVQRLKNALAAKDGEALVFRATIFMRMLLARTDSSQTYQL